MKKELRRMGLVAVFGAIAASGSGFTITPTFDSTITSDANSASIEAAINAAITAFESTFVNSVDVAIYFQEGGGLGQSNTLSYNNTYTSYYNGLVATNANPSAITGLNANGGNAGTNGGVDPVLGQSRIAVKSANGRAVGLSGDVAACVVTATGAGTSGGNVPNECGSPGPGPIVDAIVSLNTAITNPGSPGASGGFPLLATIEHEIDEVLGLGSTLNNCDSTSSPSCTAGSAYSSRGGNVAPEDLFRYDAAGFRTLSTVCSTTPFDTNLSTQPSAFFAYGKATGNIAQFNNDCNGGDFGDWQSSPLPAGVSAQVQDAFTGPGAGPALGTAEIDALSAIGYKVSTTSATPEPGTIFLLGAGLGVVLLCSRRIRAA